MSKIIRGTFFAATVISASLLIGWLSGFNFDSRSAGVGLWAGFTLVLAGIAFGAGNA
jgi:hypothetical protein